MQSEPGSRRAKAVANKYRSYPATLPIIALATAIFGSVAAAPTPSIIYRNPEYGITLPVPHGVLRCSIARQTGPDHGPVLLLKPSDASDCRSVQTIEKTRYIEVFAFYNALEDMKRLPQILRWECTEVDKGACGRPPSGLRVTGLHSESAQANLPAGWLG